MTSTKTRYGRICFSVILFGLKQTQVTWVYVWCCYFHRRDVASPPTSRVDIPVEGCKTLEDKQKALPQKKKEKEIEVTVVLLHVQKMFSVNRNIQTRIEMCSNTTTTEELEKKERAVPTGIFISCLFNTGVNVPDAHIILVFLSDYLCFWTTMLLVCVGPHWGCLRWAPVVGLRTS